MIIAITNNGYIKRTPKSEFKPQQIGTEGVIKNFYSDGVRVIKEASLGDTLLLFTEKGKCCRIDVIDIPSTEISEKGLFLNDRYDVHDDSFCEILSVKSFFASDEICDCEVLIMTRKWKIVRQRLIDYKGKKQCIKVVELNDGDYVASVALTKKEECLFNCNIYGFGKLICLEDIPIHSLKVKGVVCSSNGYYNRSVSKNNLEPSAALVCLDVCNNNETSHLLVTSQGYLCRVDSSPMLGRATSGPRLLNLRESDFVVYNSFARNNESVLVVTAEGNTLNLNISNLKTCKHGTKGSLCIKMSESDYIVACCKISPSKKIVLDNEKLNVYKQETEESQSLLSNIFNVVDEDNVGCYNSSDIVKEMLSILFGKEIWNKGELEVICKSKGIILGAVLEEINDYSYSLVDDAVIEEDGDNIYVALDYKNELL